MSFSFKETVDKKYQERYEATAPIKEVDALTFVTSSKFLDERPFPFQSLVLKLLYGLWEKYPISEEEQKLLDIFKHNWGININVAEKDPNQFIEILILVLGRRSGKTSLISFIQTYEAYKLICKGDPQKYYGIRRRHPIEITNCAADADQAKSPFTLVKNNIKRLEFFKPYIDYTKDNESELRLFTPADLLENQKIQKRNEDRSKGTPRANLLEGSIIIKAIATSASSKRGNAIISLTFDEFAHFDRAKLSGSNTTDADILTEMPHTDYAMFKALTPSVKDFGKDGKILVISSPKEKGGEFYKLYCDSGGREQINPNMVEPNPNYLMLQWATWEANPTKKYEDFEGDFKKDPLGATMEYGAHFGELSSTFMDASKVDAMVSVNKCLTTWGEYGRSYIMAVDPASKGDTYAVAWGHSETNHHGHITYYIDGIFGFRPEHKFIEGKTLRVLINPDKVLNFITGVANSLINGGGTVLEICYDQWSSASSIFALQKLGYTAFETTFTNKYKSEMYGDFLEKLNLGQIVCFGAPANDPPAAHQVDFSQNWHEQAKLELKYLEKVTSGNTTYYGAPNSGPVTTDDVADVIANVVHRLVLRNSPNAQNLKKIYQQSGKPVVARSGIKASRCSAGFFPSNPTKKLITRIRRG